MDYARILADFAKYLAANGSTVVGNVDDLAAAYLRKRTGSQQLVPGNSVGA